MAAPAVDDMAARLKDAAKVIEDAKSPLEKFHDEVNRLRDLFAEGLIPRGVFEGQVAKFRDELDKATGGIGQKIKEMKREIELIGAPAEWRRDAERRWAIADGADPGKAAELQNLQAWKADKAREFDLRKMLAGMDVDAAVEGMAGRMGRALQDALRMGLNEDQAKRLFAKAEAADLREMEKKRRDVADRLAADQPRGFLAQSGEGMIARFLTKVTAEKFAEQTAINTAEAVQVLRELKAQGADVVAIGG